MAIYTLVYFHDQMRLREEREDVLLIGARVILNSIWDHRGRTGEGTHTISFAWIDVLG